LLVLGGIGLLGVTVCCCVPGGVGGYFWWSAKTTAEERQARIEKGEDVVITAEDMGRQYAENEVGGDAKFQDKIVTVTGRVIFISGDSIRLQPGVPQGMLVIGGVYCTFGDKYKAHVAGLKHGDRVTIRGYCTGKGFAETGKLIYCKKIDEGGKGVK
jgi:hypothetical protein